MKINFVLASTEHGTMIVPRNDYRQLENGWELGVGGHIFQHGHHELYFDLTILKAIVDMQHKMRGPGVVVIDGGANIGTVTLTLAHHMLEFGFVHAFEPQDRIFMALCGNVVMNNLENVRTYRTALNSMNGVIEFPVPDYSISSNFGGVSVENADIGQKLENTMLVAMKTIDSLNLERLDLLKLDIEGMEINALLGSQETIERCKPVIIAEHIKSDVPKLQKFFECIEYQTEFAGINLVAAPPGHEILTRLHHANEAYKAA